MLVVLIFIISFPVRGKAIIICIVSSQCKAYGPSGTTRAGENGEKH